MSIAIKGARTLRRQGFTVLLTVSALCILAIISLSQAVTRDLRLLETANSDNVQWTLAQAEVEFMEFHHVLEENLLSPALDARAIRRAFDVFYSRIVTLESGRLYDGLRQNSDFTRSLGAARQYLNTHVGLIDALESADRARVITLEQDAENLRDTVRRIANSGLYYFASQSDERRESIAISLKRLALVTTSLIAALALLAYYSHRVGRQSQRSRMALQIAHTRLNSIVTASLDAVIVSDRQGRIVEYNASAEKVFGYTLDEVLGKSLADVVIPPHLRDAHTAGMKRMMDGGAHRVVGHGRVKLEGMRKSGEVFPVELALEAAGDGDDMIVIGFMRDISAQVAAEQELVEARDRALAGEKAKADFLAVMTHEIRTPLNGVLGNLSLLEDTRLTRQQERYAANMSISAKQLMRHVDTVLDIARFESGQIAPDESPTHLGTLLQDIVDGQSGYAEANGNRLERGWIGPSVDWVMTDAARLQQVLLNLVGNAIKFTEGGKISIEAERLYRNLGDQSVEVEFRIIDTGIGISPADQERIFEDFQTVDTSFQRSAGGTGLGLGIVRRLVEAMGGTLGVESETGEGSVFWVRLPFVETSRPAPEMQSKQATNDRAPLEILVVEDNEINLHLVCELLQKKGHQVRTATNGLDGVHMAGTQRFDLILMDISMPVMDGLEACRRIRDEDGPSHLSPIVALSANVLPEVRGQIVDAGMTGFLGKPLQREELDAVLNAARRAPVPQPVSTSQTDPEDDVLAALKSRFIDEADSLMAWLGTTPDDTNEIAARCHKVAGSAAAFGQLDLRDALVQIEQAANSPDQLGKLTARIKTAQAIWSEHDPEMITTG
ncbi:MAG: ATP-binding protein [Thalassovita sp.]